MGRDSAGRRRYTRGDLDWLVLLNRLRRTGMPVRDMRRYAELAPARRPDRRARPGTARGAPGPGPGERSLELKEDLSVLNYKIEMYDRLSGSMEACEEVPA